MGAGARLPVGCGDMFRRRSGREHGRAVVGAGARLPVGLDDVLLRGCEQAHGGAAVGAGARLPVGCERLCTGRIGQRNWRRRSRPRPHQWSEGAGGASGGG